MNFSLQILGAASAMPNSEMNPSAQALTVQGRLFLIDCGEGAQQRMRQMHLSFLKVEAIFISHIHGDHLFGLFGLLNTMEMYGRTADLHIYGPQALGSVLNFYRSFFGEWNSYEIKFTPVSCQEPTLIHKSKWVQVSAFPLRHKIECYGYRFDGILTERRMREHPEERPRSYAYCSDTVPFAELADWVRGVDVLYHETTYPCGMEDKAEKHWHSTSAQAAQCARDAGAGRLLVGHYSSRIQDFDALLGECRAIFPDTDLTEDLEEFNF